MARMNNALGIRVPEDVARIPDMTEEETALGDIGVLGARIVRDMDIGEGPKRAEVINLRLTTVEGFKRGLAIERGVYHPGMMLRMRYELMRGRRLR